ncbi:MAG: PH domain-containing protein [Muribaculaceae bacterium]|nr:PH domain-containing protein [Muribaculaceae bacterium]
MRKDNKLVFRSKIDWWIACLILFSVVTAWVAFIGTSLWLALLFGGSMTALCAIGIFGCWYEIRGNQLIVYQFFKPHTFPIDKIKEVKKTIGYLATAGMSSRRVSIKFVDRSVMKSSMPLEISPADRDGFISALKHINPEIIVAG